MKFEKNTKGRDFVVGDLHGNYDLLVSEMEKVGFDKSKDRMFSVGDLIDRGLQNERCLLLATESWFYAVKGNHEQMMVNAVTTHDSQLLYHWYMNGGSWAMHVDEDELFYLSEIAKSLPHMIEVETDKGWVGIVHAESHTEWYQNLNFDEEKHLWSRERIKASDPSKINGIETVYVGHTPVDEPVRLGNTWYIDTGAFFSKKLTLARIQ